MDRKLQVFVSSTFLDLKAERQAAVEAILDAGHIPAGMELFAAADESQMETIRRWIDESDVFLLILGGRYGTIEQKAGKSYTHLEYEYAGKKKKPRFAAIAKEEYTKSKVAALTAEVVLELENPKLLKDFRATFNEKTSRFFVNLDQLKNIIFKSLQEYGRDDTLAGWVRATEAIDPKKTLEQMTRLQGENAQLRSRVESLEAAAGNATPIADRLSADAAAMLMAAREANGGLAFEKGAGFRNLIVGKTTFFDFKLGHSPRDEARWQAAIDELLEYVLIKLTSLRAGETYLLTKLGWETADAIVERETGSNQAETPSA